MLSTALYHTRLEEPYLAEGDGIKGGRVGGGCPQQHLVTHMAEAVAVNCRIGWTSTLPFR